MDEEKWNAILKQWEADDEEEAKDGLESTTDAYALAQPETWAAQDLANKPIQGPQPQAEPPPPSAVARPTGPTTMGVGEKSARPPPVPQRGKPMASSGPDWQSIQSALTNANLRAMQTHAGESLRANAGEIGAYRPDMGAGQQQIAAARIPLDVANAKQGYEQREKAAGLKSAMDDPNSLQSQKAREAWRAFGLQTPPGFDEWSAADVQRFTASGQAKRAADEKNADDATKAKALADKAAGEKASLESSRRNFAKELEALGVDPATASQKDIDRAISLKHAAATEHVASSNLAIAQSNRKDKDDDRAALGGAIPFADGELVYSGSGVPREDDKREAQKVSKAANGAIAGMNDLEKAMAAFAQNPSPATRDEVVAKTRVVSGALNTAAEQGAMSKDEADEMAKALGVSLTAPGSLAAAWEKLFGNDQEAAASMTRRVKSVRDAVKNVAVGKAKVFGFDFKPSGAAAQETPDIPVEEERIIDGVKYRKKNGKWVTGG